MTGLCFPAIASCIYVDGPAHATTDNVSDSIILPNAYYSVQIAWDVRSTDLVHCPADAKTDDVMTQLPL